MIPSISFFKSSPDGAFDQVRVDDVFSFFVGRSLVCVLYHLLLSSRALSILSRVHFAPAELNDPSVSPAVIVFYCFL